MILLALLRRFKKHSRDRTSSVRLCSHAVPRGRHIRRRWTPCPSHDRGLSGYQAGASAGAGQERQGLKRLGAFFFSRIREFRGYKTVPQGLKPGVAVIYGTAEAVPFLQDRVLTQFLKPVVVQLFSARLKVVSFLKTQFSRRHSCPTLPTAKRILFTRRHGLYAQIGLGRNTHSIARRGDVTLGSGTQVFQAEECGYHGIDVFEAVVESQRGTDRGLKAEPA
jgi:hypothetical protein